MRQIRTTFALLLAAVAFTLASCTTAEQKLDNCIIQNKATLPMELGQSLIWQDIAKTDSSVVFQYTYDEKEIPGAEVLITPASVQNMITMNVQQTSDSRELISLVVGTGRGLEYVLTCDHVEETPMTRGVLRAPTTRRTTTKTHSVTLSNDDLKVCLK